MQAARREKREECRCSCIHEKRGNKISCPKGEGGSKEGKRENENEKETTKQTKTGMEINRGGRVRGKIWERKEGI